MTVQNVKSNALDDILINFNLFGNYHRKVSLLVFIAFITNSIYCMNYIFVAESVTYSCNPNQCEVKTNLPPETCATHVFPDDDKDCNYLNKSILEKCHNWVFEKPNSFVAEFGIACEEWKRNLVGTIHSVGYMAGLLVIGPLSDRIGRKKTLIATGVIGGVAGLARSFVTSYWLYIALEFLEAFIGDICSPIFMLAVEIVATAQRPMIYTILQFGYPVGGIIFALISWGVPYFRTRLRIIYTPALLFIFYNYLIDESPRWLLIKGKKEKTVAILEDAAQSNGITLDRAMLNKLTIEGETKSIGFGEVLKTTFKSSAMLKRFLICFVWWTTCTFTTYGITLNSVSLDGNKYLNFIYACTADAVGGLLTGLFMSKLSRKNAMLVSFVAGAMFMLSNPFLPKNLTWLSITLYMSGKAMTTLFFNVTYVYTSELFPTYTRNSMHALCSSSGRIGSIVASQTPLLLPYWSGLPSFLFGTSCVVAALTTLFVPDTKDAALPDTVDQAEKVGATVKQ